jgi:DNA mismatch repair protein MutL
VVAAFAAPQSFSIHSAVPSLSPRRIQQLSPLVASQIAAGEVVERPASVVKELVENAIDAGAARIAIDLEQGGIELVRVADDGHGIPRDELALALSPHATSKVASAADLEHIATLGFRGEALASIASVARLTIRSRTRDEAEASELSVEGEDHWLRTPEPRPAAGPAGTVVSVRTLFFNTPARRKFLRTVGTEQARCQEIIHQLALAQPGIAFTLTVDGRRSLDLPRDQSPRERALAILGKELESELLEVHADRFDEAPPGSSSDSGTANNAARAGSGGGVTLWGLVGRPSVARATNKAQHLFINGRAVRDRTIQHAVSEAFRGLIEPSRYPTAVLMIEMNPAAVDVNVHPTKAEVRFRDSSLMHSIVMNAIRRTLRAADLTPTFTPNSGSQLNGATLSPGGTLAAGAWGMQILPSAAASAPAYAGAPTAGLRAEDFAAFFKRTIPSRTQGDLSYSALREALAPDGSAAGYAPMSAETAASAAADPAPAGTAVEAGLANGLVGGDAATAAAGAIPLPMPTNRVLQVHNSYLVTQDDQGVLIVDQHALHERVMFEYLLMRVTAGTLESQRLLTPAVVPAAPRQVDRLVELKPLLDKIGIEAEPLGSASVGVHAFASFLFERGVDPVPFVQDLLERADNEDFISAVRAMKPVAGERDPHSEAVLRDVLDMMACKAAVKAGDKLSEGELDELLKLRAAVERSSNCPHGRPTTIRLTIKDLERLFGRT